MRVSGSGLKDLCASRLRWRRQRAETRVRVVGGFARAKTTAAHSALSMVAAVDLAQLIELLCATEGVVCVVTELVSVSTGVVGLEPGGGGSVGALSNKEVLLLPPPIQVAGTLRECERMGPVGAGAGGGGATAGAGVSEAADSGCRKLRRWSMRSACCLKHRVRTSGSVSNCSWMALSFSSSAVRRSSRTSCRVFMSDTISYTVFCVQNTKL